MQRSLRWSNSILFCSVPSSAGLIFVSVLDCFVFEGFILNKIRRGFLTFSIHPNTILSLFCFSFSCWPWIIVLKHSSSLLFLAFWLWFESKLELEGVGPTFLSFSFPVVVVLLIFLSLDFPPNPLNDFFSHLQSLLHKSHRRHFLFRGMKVDLMGLQLSKITSMNRSIL